MAPTLGWTQATNSMSLEQPALEQRLQAIEERNRRVETEKAWETSTTRKATVALLTYAVVVLAMVGLDIQRPFLNAVIPSLGFVLSTLTLPLVRQRWVVRQAREPKA